MGDNEDGSEQAVQEGDKCAAPGADLSRCVCGCSYPCTCDLMKTDLADIISEMVKSGAVPDDLGLTDFLNKPYEGDMVVELDDASFDVPSEPKNPAQPDPVDSSTNATNEDDQEANELLPEQRPKNYENMTVNERKRYKNNLASRISRARKRTDHNKLLQENHSLKKENSLLKAESQYLRSIIQVGRAAPIPNFDYLRFDSCNCGSGQTKSAASPFAQQSAVCGALPRPSVTAAPMNRTSCCGSSQPPAVAPIAPKPPVQIRSGSGFCCSSKSISHASVVAPVGQMPIAQIPIEGLQASTTTGESHLLPVQSGVTSLQHSAMVRPQYSTGSLHIQPELCHQHQIPQPGHTLHPNQIAHQQYLPQQQLGAHPAHSQSPEVVHLQAHQTNHNSPQHSHINVQPNLQMNSQQNVHLHAPPSLGLPSPHNIDSGSTQSMHRSPVNSQQHVHPSMQQGKYNNHQQIHNHNAQHTNSLQGSQNDLTQMYKGHGNFLYTSPNAALQLIPGSNTASHMNGNSSIGLQNTPLMSGGVDVHMRTKLTPFEQTLPASASVGDEAIS
ncbi:hypothetical protein SARC_00188 [Sphaeroforma arctica JP610]|uniref:BZIP domain-containing protein n=1 Tax=Sphaeroforma arctica JP610 TaxID=667725 RepID=A0A0L0GF64_9EUKA|nr:hypothetical protein SARC_00188 [Sphaeroforma arctica JP610]KNC87680.1 hypothetical protein SARC_00188 [Sphaeroforma arctica JP610]|eukprot:XP_014161582.1 hypothetical protein SARC_00188 [Sphaeroforma arctica JP610]